MDHISINPVSATDSFDVPCRYRHREDDFPPFAKYPHILGWSDDDANFAGNWSSDPKWDNFRVRKPVREAELLLQGWLYFGLIRTFFAADSTSMFQQWNKDGHCFITTKYLHQLLSLQQTYYLNMEAEHLKAVLVLQRVCLAKTREILANVYRDHSRVNGKIVFSIAILAQRLETFLYQRQIDRKQDLTDLGQLVSLHSWPLGAVYASDFITSRLKSAGWCPHEIHRIKQLSPASRYIVSFMERPHPELRHGDDCDDEHCVAYNLVESDYETKHVCGTGKCSWIEAESERLMSILNEDDIPVVLLEEDSPFKYSLRVQKASECKDYVAISHVWSDGLGNPQANALPLCQAQRLARLARNTLKYLLT
jgi:hypothetical protein